MSGRSWRERTCTACGVIRGAGDFKPVGTYRQPWETGSVPRRCPDCGNVGPTSSFPVVAEHRAPKRWTA